MHSTFEDKKIPVTSVASGIGLEVRPGIYMYTVQEANIFFVGGPEQWVLVDAGFPDSHEEIMAEAEKRFGSEARPAAIVLTHGHFDHVGSIVHLVKSWKTPVYAHPLEMPYLNGSADYPPADPAADGGLVTELSRLFPNDGIDLGPHLIELPPDGNVPYMKGWRWVHTPGHTPGHISLFRDSDRALIVGDAFCTVKQESLYKTFTQEREISGPPKYFTTDWKASERSVKLLHDLRPSFAVSGHGRPMEGPELQASLDTLVRDFGELAVPEHGRFVTN